MSELHDAVAAYAMDALDVQEQAEFERHLQTCADCRAELGELRGIAAGLVLTGAAPPPPPDLRAAVLAAVVGVEQLPPRSGRPRRAMPSPDGTDETDEPEVTTSPVAAVAAVAAGDPVDELALRRTNRRARVLSVLVAAATVVALALGGVVYSLARQADTPPVAAPQLPQVDPSLLAAPDAQILPTTLKNGARVSFVVSKSQNRAAIVSTDLPLPGTGNEYQLWTLKGDTVVRRDNTLPGGTNQVQLFSGPVDDSTALAVNIEPAGSNPQAPTTTVLGAVDI